ncbi:AMP-binding protein [Brevundimonas sp. NPDC090276]|uniref:AMP-binding protein n=1 Tax=Brevundimonas sp. NPDC090276 TaxID=3363956 RepID=UPI00383A38AB
MDRHAVEKGDKACVHFVTQGETTPQTYASMRTEALRAAAMFDGLGLEAGSVVFIVLRHQAELYSTFLGAMYAGLTPSFLPFPTPKQDANLYWSSHRELFRRVEPGLVLTYAENIAPLREALDGLQAEVLDVRRVADFQPREAGLNPAADRVALLQHSSGTTGLKKGVMLTFGEIAAQTEGYAKAIDFDANDVVVSWLPLYHDMGLLSSFLIPLALGATIVSLDAFEWVSKPAMLLEAIERHRGTLSWMPNFAFNHIARLRPSGSSYDLTSMRAFIACSEPCKEETFAQFADRFADCGVTPRSIQACYAMAETVFAVTQSNLDTPPAIRRVDGDELDRTQRVRLSEADGRAYVSNGRPIEGLEIAIDSAEGRLLWSPAANSRATGDIVVRGVSLFSGYYRNPEATVEALNDGWYTTGDVGFFADGELYICGRRKELLIVHGKNYYATDIEEAVNRIEGVKPGRAVAFALYSERTQSEEGYVVVESERSAETWTALKRAIKEGVFSQLDLTLQTVLVVEPGWLVKTTSGKISRKENAQKYLAAKDARP